MPRIWFNRTYATTYHVIAMLRDNPQGRAVHVIGSHTDADSPVLPACDEALPEPETDADAYVEWAVGFARHHQVDVLVPRQYIAELADAREQFEAVGTALLCPDGDTVRLFEDKPAGYRAAAALGLLVPAHHVVHDSGGLRAAYEDLAEIAEQVCMKPVTGVGGMGYRRLTARPSRLADFAGEVRSKVHVDDVCTALDAAASAGEPVPPLLVMPFLDGPEISVDVLATVDGDVLAAIGRRHAPRRRVLVDDLPARHVAEVLTRAHAVAYLSNTQVRYWQGPGDEQQQPYLLELNARAAGGLFQTALAGVNLPWAAIQLALGERVELPEPRYGAGYTRIDTVVALP